MAAFSNNPKCKFFMTDAMATTAGNIGLKVSTKKTKGMRMNARVQENIKLNGDEIEEVDVFT